MNIAFWNVNKNKEINETLSALVQEKDLDILILAEYDDDIEKFCRSINNGSKTFTPIINIGCDKIKGIINVKYHQEPLYAITRYSVLGIKTTYFKMILCMIHGESNPRADSDDRQATFNYFYSDILKSEAKFKTNNSIIIGDLNSNPFDRDVIGISSLHAIPYKEEVSVPTRVKTGIEYKKFYNPTWRFLGSKTPPYGTYYYNTSRAINYYWNTFDQVLLRPCLVPAFDEDSLNIITEINGKTILKNNYKPDLQYSDHLPIFLKIQEEKIK